MGSLLWLGQLYFHIGFELTALATSICTINDSIQNTRDFPSTKQDSTGTKNDVTNILVSGPARKCHKNN